MNTYKLANKSYSRRYGTYNAVWMNEKGEAAFWGNYNPDNRSFYLAVPGSILSEGRWIERWDGDYEFKCQGCYNYDDVRKAIQFGIF